MAVYGQRAQAEDVMLGSSREEKAEMVRTWLEDIPLSRPKKHVGRDLADAVIAAEIVRFYLPRFVEIHNYVPSHGNRQKTINWKTLNRKTLSKLNIEIPDDRIQDLVASKSNVAEEFLLTLRDRIFAELEEQRQRAQAKALGSNRYLDDMRQDSYDAAVARARKRLLRPENGTGHENHTSYSSLQPHPGQRHDHLPAAAAAAAGARTWPAPHGRPPRHVPTDSYEEVASAGDTAAMEALGGLSQRNRGWQAAGPDISIVLEEKEQTILELQETVQLMTVKVRRLEGLLRVKDLRIEDLTSRLQNLVAGQSSERPPRRKRG